MPVTVEKPWAILVCRFEDDPNNPEETRVMDLAAQWRAERDQKFIDDNLTPAWDTDARVILDLYNAFFTVSGVFTFNIVHYFNTMTHGRFDLTANQVFPCVIDVKTADIPSLGTGEAFLSALLQRGKQALLAQHGVNWNDYFGVAISLLDPRSASHGYTSLGGGPAVFADIRFVVNNGTAGWGHEMGHAFGLGHSRTDGINTGPAGGEPGDYTDVWDVMSWGNVRARTDPVYGQRGPGLNAWNMRHIQGLDEGRVWRPSPPDVDSFTEVVELRPLHDTQKAGYLAAELPGAAGHSAYLVEYRVPTLWDEDFGRREVLVHRFEGAKSYIMRSTNGSQTLEVGESVQMGSGPVSRVTVLDIDPVHEVATVELIRSQRALPLPVHVDRPAPSVKIEMPNHGATDPCAPEVPVAGSVAEFVVKLNDLAPGTSYQIEWGVTGGKPLPGQSSTQASFSISVPVPWIHVFVSVDVTLEDGTVLSDEFGFKPLDAGSAQLIRMLCELSHERTMPVPWWEWDPWKIRDTMNPAMRERIAVIEQRAVKLAQTIRRVREMP